MSERQGDRGDQRDWLRGVPPDSRVLPVGRRAAIPEMPDQYRYSLPDLERETGMPGRRIRYYISQGLLAPAYGRGPSATYDAGHLLRLRLIDHLKGQRLTLPQIKERLADLSDEDMATLLGVHTRPVEATWRRITIDPRFEILAIAPEGDRPDPSFEAAVEAIVTYARSVFDRDGSRP
ncbi:MAG: helix-turn-helix domain-containing protein [Thermomicrobiales bacterium]